MNQFEHELLSVLNVRISLGSPVEMIILFITPQLVLLLLTCFGGNLAKYVVRLTVCNVKVGYYPLL